MSWIRSSHHPPRRLPRSTATALALIVLASVATTLAGDARAGSPGDCIQIESATAFSPRGEIYVEVRSRCVAEDFAVGDPVIAYLEVLLGDLPPSTQAVRAYHGQPDLRETVVFDNLSFSKGDEILIRLVNSGQIVGLRTISAP